MTEIWKPVNGWPYEVSNLGRVMNSKTGRILRQSPHKSGYLNVQLWANGLYRTYLAHRLVAAAFLGEPPTEKHEVAHGDGNRHNNASSNLRWVTHMENMRDRDAHGATARGKANGKLKHPADVVLKARELYDSGMSLTDIGRELGISTVTAEGFAKRTRRQILN